MYRRKGNISATCFSCSKQRHRNQSTPRYTYNVKPRVVQGQVATSLLLDKFSASLSSFRNGGQQPLQDAAPNQNDNETNKPMKVYLLSYFFRFVFVSQAIRSLSIPLRLCDQIYHHAVPGKRGVTFGPEFPLRQRCCTGINTSPFVTLSSASLTLEEGYPANGQIQFLLQNFISSVQRSFLSS